MGTPSIYSPDYFMDHNVILVFLQYRLGPFGMEKNYLRIKDFEGIKLFYRGLV